MLAVMVREDVWQAYCTVEGEERYDDPIPTVEAMADQLKKIMAKSKKDKSVDDWLLRQQFMRWLIELPFSTNIPAHLIAAMEKKTFKQMDELIWRCAEVARVEMVMARTTHAWFIPPLGRQDQHWETRFNLERSLAKICETEYDKEQELYAEWDKEA